MTPVEWNGRLAYRLQALITFCFQLSSLLKTKLYNTEHISRSVSESGACVPSSSIDSRRNCDAVHRIININCANKKCRVSANSQTRFYHRRRRSCVISRSVAALASVSVHASRLIRNVRHLSEMCRWPSSSVVHNVAPASDADAVALRRRLLVMLPAGSAADAEEASAAAAATAARRQRQSAWSTNDRSWTAPCRDCPLMTSVMFLSSYELSRIAGYSDWRLEMWRDVT